MTILVLVLNYHMFVQVNDGLPMGPGPGGGGEGIGFLIVWVVRLLALGALAVCLMTLPRGAAWNWRVVTTTFLVCVGVGASAYVLDRKMQQYTVLLSVKDMAGAPVAGALVHYRTYDKRQLPLSRRREHRGVATTDGRGQVRLDLPRFRTLYLDVGEGEVRQRLAIYDYQDGKYLAQWEWDVESSTSRPRADSKIYHKYLPSTEPMVLEMELRTGRAASVPYEDR